MPKFKALSYGTMSNPYREIQKDQIVDLTDDEAKIYAKSKWLIPLKVAQNMKPQPLMSHMAQETELNPAAKMPAYALEKSKTPDGKKTNYDMQMEALQRKEAAEDHRLNLPPGSQLDANTGEAAQTGTGNHDPLA